MESNNQLTRIKRHETSRFLFLLVLFTAACTCIRILDNNGLPRGESLDSPNKPSGLFQKDHFHQHVASISSHSSPLRLEIFLIMWNDIGLLPFTVKFYKKRFPGNDLQITIYDNESQDGSAEVAKSLGCRVVAYSTGNKLDDGMYIRIKNECWKESKADWVIIADLDEWVDVWPSNLTSWEALKVTAVQPKGMILVWPNDTMDLTEAARGIWGDMAGGGANNYGKPCLFDRRRITNINIGAGGHTLLGITGNVKWLSDIPLSISHPWLYHAKYFSTRHLFQRGKEYFQRLSEKNKEMEWATRYFTEPSMTAIEHEFKSLREQSLPIPGGNSKNHSLF